MLGMRMSETTALTDSLSSRASALHPSAASMVFQPSNSNRTRSNLRLVGWSSTIKIFMKALHLNANNRPGGVFLPGSGGKRCPGGGPRPADGSSRSFGARRFGYDLAQLLRQRARAEGLGQESVAAGAEDLVLGVPFGIRAHRHDVNVLGLGMRLQLARQGEPVHPGQVHIQKDDVGPVLADSLESLLGGVGIGHVMAGGAQDVMRQPQLSGMIFNYQDLHQFCLSRKPWRAPKKPRSRQAARAY